MARPLRINYAHGFYHVTCRGNESRNIFKDDQDRILFLGKLKTSLEIYSVKLHAYVLMSNHFHLIVETPKANLSEFMRHFNVSYTGAYNRRHKRVGHLYQGRYKAIVVEKDSYLLELSRYVHLNPIRIHANQKRPYREQVKRLRNYQWSSLGGYLDSKRADPRVSYGEVLGQVQGSRKRYKEFVEQGIKAGYDTPWHDLKGQMVLGEEGFLEKLQATWKGKSSKREQPSVRAFESVAPDAILRIISRYFGVKAQQIAQKRSGYRDERGAAMELIFRYSGLNQVEIGKRLGGLDYTAVSRERKRLRERLPLDRRLNAAMEELETMLMTKVKI